ncbi:MAG: hypothetical protein HRT61_24705 [Ekhidna sp.]|nr:hypothetical protein [Ekhidna sp.]
MQVSFSSSDSSFGVSLVSISLAVSFTNKLPSGIGGDGVTSLVCVFSPSSHPIASYDQI